MTHWPVLLFLAGLTTIPTELITPWTDHSSTHSGSSMQVSQVQVLQFTVCNLVLHTLAATHIACVCACFILVTLNVLLMFFVVSHSAVYIYRLYYWHVNNILP